MGEEILHRRIVTGCYLTPLSTFALQACGPARCYSRVVCSFSVVPYYCAQRCGHTVWCGTFSRTSTKVLLCLFQNSLLREVETAKKQLEEAQHDKVRPSLSPSEICGDVSGAEFRAGSVATGVCGGHASPQQSAAESFTAALHERGSEFQSFLIHSKAETFCKPLI